MLFSQHRIRLRDAVRAFGDGAFQSIGLHGEVLGEEETDGAGGPERRSEVRLTDKELGRFEALEG